MISVESQRTPDDMLREWPGLVQDALTIAAFRWHLDFLPQHFAAGNARKYGHLPRHPKYLRRKERLGRIGRYESLGLVDNVKTGDLRRQMTASARVRIAPNRATLIMSGPSYLRVRTGGRLRQREELTAIQQDEGVSLSETVLTESVNALNSLNRPHTERFQ